MCVFEALFGTVSVPRRWEEPGFCLVGIENNAGRHTAVIRVAPTASVPPINQTWFAADPRRPSALGKREAGSIGIVTCLVALLAEFTACYSFVSLSHAGRRSMNKVLVGAKRLTV